MKKQNGMTELVFILDRSGSMAGLEQDTIGGYNAMLKKQKAAPGNAIVTTALFDNRYELLHDRADIRAIAPITRKEYYVRGTTALLDAVGKTIEKTGNAQKSMAPAYRADKVIVVITTDGLENASHEYTFAQVRAMVTRQKERYGWEFIFLGANIDAVETAKEFGIGHEYAANYHADSAGVELNYKVVSEAICKMRACPDEVLQKDWKAEIEADFDARK